MTCTLAGNTVKSSAWIGKINLKDKFRELGWNALEVFFI